MSTATTTTWLPEGDGAAASPSSLPGVAPGEGFETHSAAAGYGWPVMPWQVVGGECMMPAPGAWAPHGLGFMPSTPPMFPPPNADLMFYSLFHQQQQQQQHHFHQQLLTAQRHFAVPQRSPPFPHSPEGGAPPPAAMGPAAPAPLAHLPEARERRATATAHKEGPREGPPGANLFVFHVPNEATNKQLFDVFSGAWK